MERWRQWEGWRQEVSSGAQTSSAGEWATPAASPCASVSPRPDPDMRRQVGAPQGAWALADDWEGTSTRWLATWSSASPNIVGAIKFHTVDLTGELLVLQVWRSGTL